MHQFNHIDIKRFWQTLFIFCFVANLLVPSFHNHEHSHADGAVNYGHNFSAADHHNHETLHEGEYHSEWSGESLLAPEVSFTYYSVHDHNRGQHFYFLDIYAQRAERTSRNLANHKTFLLISENPAGFASANRHFGFSGQRPTRTSILYPEDIFAVTDLPPPIV